MIRIAEKRKRATLLKLAGEKVDKEWDLCGTATWKYILKEAQRGLTITEIRGLLGVTEREWKRAVEEHEGLRATCEFAKIRYESFLQNAARKRVKEGSDVLIKFLLERTVEGYTEQSRVTVENTGVVGVVSFADFKRAQAEKRKELE